jgi:hypothetical protein
MDLGCVARWVQSRSHYGVDHQKFARDVNLVWSNCMAYNMEGSEIGLISQRYVHSITFIC